MPGYLGSIILRNERTMLPGDADRYVVQTALMISGGTFNCPELLDLADRLGDARISGIVSTMRSTLGRRYARVTPAQTLAVADAILGKYGTARAACAAALGITEAELISAGEDW